MSSWFRFDTPWLNRLFLTSVRTTRSFFRRGMCHVRHFILTILFNRLNTDFAIEEIHFINDHDVLFDIPSQN